MLIVAIPKSASTSLHTTIAHAHKIPALQEHYKENPIPPETEYLHKWHSCVRTLYRKDIDHIVLEKSGTLFKQHFPPTDHNLSLLQGVKKVILLRDVREVVDAYWRAKCVGIYVHLTGEFAGVSSRNEWIALTKETGLWEDLEYFYSRWKAVPEDENTIHITYSDVVQRPADTIARVEDFFELGSSGKTVLEKKRYSREMLSIAT